MGGRITRKAWVNAYKASKAAKKEEYSPKITGPESYDPGSLKQQKSLNREGEVYLPPGAGELKGLDGSNGRLPELPQERARVKREPSRN